MNFLSTMVDDLIERLKFATVLKGGNFDEAVQYVKDCTCAGEKAWEIALNTLKNHY